MNSTEQAQKNKTTPRPRRFDWLALFVCLLLALAFRLPGLTAFLTADEPRSWFGRSIIFLDSLSRFDWANTGPGGTVPYLENVSLSPAPGVTTMWAGSGGLMVEYIRQGGSGSISRFLAEVPFDPLDPAMLFSLRLPGVLVAAAAVALTYWWSRPLIGRWGALLAAALLALDPFYLALSRVLGHDALVSTFMWLSLLAFLRAMAERGRQTAAGKKRFVLPHTPFLLCSGALAGLAFLSKYPALFVGAFVALAMLVVYLLQARTPHPPEPAPGVAFRAARFGLFASRVTRALDRWIRDLALWSLAAGVVFILLWPAMWVDPLGPVTTIMNDALRASGGAHPKGSFFLGRPVPDPGLLFYPVVTLLRTTPVTFFGLLISLWLLARRIFRRQPDRATGSNRPTAPDQLFRTSLILLAYILLYTLLVTYAAKSRTVTFCRPFRPFRCWRPLATFKFPGLSRTQSGSNKSCLRWC